jgi:cytidylate kinase
MYAPPFSNMPGDGIEGPEHGGVLVMTVNAQAVIDAMIRALEEPPHEARHPRRLVITVSRSTASRGDAIARALADRLKLDCYDREILDRIAAEAGVSSTLVERLTEKLDAVDSWIYSAIFGKRVTRTEYLKFVTTIIRALYHTGGVIVGRGGHIILAGRDILRVRIVGSLEVCASRLSEEQGISYIKAKNQVEESNARREKFVWEVFQSRYDDATVFDVIINTDQFRHDDGVVDILVQALRSRGLLEDIRPATAPIRR